MRIVAAIIAFSVLGAGVFFTYEFFDGRRVLVSSDPTYAVTAAEDLLRVLVLLGIALASFVALFIYAVLTTRDAAKRMAYVLSKDMSSSKEQFRKLYDMSPVPYLLIDARGTIDRPNKAALRFFGAGEEVLRGKNFFSVLALPDQPDKLALYKERISRHVSVEQVEVQAMRNTGEVRWVLLSVEDLHTPGEERRGLVTLVDIHDQKELERMKTEFLSLASHQLRAPLANLKWYIDFLLTRRANVITGDVLTYLHKMYRRNEEMIELVNTLLNLSRVEMGRVKVDLEKTELGDTVRSVVEELEPAAKEKQIAIATTIEAVSLETDGKLVRIIIQNLLSNAIRYTPASGQVEVRLRSAPGRGAEVTVTDTGIGIPPEEQAHIFSKLYRAKNAKEMEVNGNGIGLYMCKALAESMGGRIDFTSTMGKGTTFTLTLPS
jgi:PAS domain S-box-containing protein